MKWVEDFLFSKKILEEANLFNHERENWSGVTIDSRKDCVSKLFFALAGESTDGHLFMVEAFKKGAVAVVISSDSAKKQAEKGSIPFLKVADTLKALQELAGGYRQNLQAKVIAVTGSSGKTTTKELLSSLLSSEHSVHCNPGNYNNQIGVPLTILGTEENTEYLISEVGANHTGEVAFLGEMLLPSAGIVTNVGDAHIGYFGSREKIAETKAELLELIPEEGYAVLPGDDKFLEFFNERCKCPVISFGFSDGCDFRISDYEGKMEESSFRVDDVTMTTKLPGRHNALNVAGAFSIGIEEGLEKKKAVKVISSFKPLKGRGRILQGRGIILFDDAYNANPSSMEAVLESFLTIVSARRFAVLGDMLELGEAAAKQHKTLGEHLALTGFEKVYWKGEFGGFVREGMRGGKGCELIEFESNEKITELLLSKLKPGDALLVKGSHACGLESLVAELVEEMALREEH